MGTVPPPWAGIHMSPVHQLGAVKRGRSWDEILAIKDKEDVEPELGKEALRGLAKSSVCLKGASWRNSSAL